MLRAAQANLSPHRMNRRLRQLDLSRLRKLFYSIIFLRRGFKICCTSRFKCLICFVVVPVSVKLVHRAALIEEKDTNLGLYLRKDSH